MNFMHSQCNQVCQNFGRARKFNSNNRREFCHQRRRFKNKVSFFVGKGSPIEKLKEKKKKKMKKKMKKMKKMKCRLLPEVAVALTRIQYQKKKSKKKSMRKETSQKSSSSSVTTTLRSD